MKFLIFLLFVASSYAIDFNCLKGPSFWCATHENAVNCGRIIECSIRNPNSVVKMEKIKETNYCTLCEEVVGKLEKEIIPQFTETEFINFVTLQICPKLENDLEQLCVTLVRQYGHEIYTELQNFIDPNNLCSFMQLCKTDIKRIGSQETCKICKEVFSVLESLINSVTPDEIKLILKMFLCKTLPSSLETMCDTLVDSFTDQIYELLKSLLDGNRVCPALHLCSSPSNNKVSDWQQKTCVDVAAVLKIDLINVSTNDITNAVDAKACAKVPSFFRGICDKMINENLAAFMTKLHSNMTPQQICAEATDVMPKALERTTTLNAENVVECSACQYMVKEFRKMITSPAEVLKLKNFIKNNICKYFGNEKQKCVDFVDKYLDILITFINSELTDRQICQLFGLCSDSETVSSKLSSNVVGGVECDACKLFLSEIKKFISDPNHVGLLKNFFKNVVCSFFRQEKTQCQQVVEEYFSIIFNAIISQFDVDTICKFGKFCAKSSLINDVSRSETVQCEVCEAVMDEIINVVTTNASQQVVMNFLTTKVCPELNVLKDECISIVTTYVPYIFNIARKSLNSKILCARLHLCSAEAQKKMNALLRSLTVKSEVCDICQFVVKELKSLLSDTSIQTMIENFLKNEICSHFGLNKEQCEKDITEYYSAVINLILSFLTPNICTDIRLCNKVTSEPLVKKSIECIICPKFYNFLKNIKDKSSNTDIILGLVNICNRHYNENKIKCLNVLKNVDFLVQSSKWAKNREQFCKITKMCISKNIILGDKRCIWGPGFWCAHRSNAELCGIGAVRHCELNMWKLD